MAISTKYLDGLDIAYLTNVKISVWALTGTVLLALNNYNYNNIRIVANIYQISWAQLTIKIILIMIIVLRWSAARVQLGLWLRHCFHSSLDYSS